MPAFLHPGVYMLEVPSPAKSIEAAGTSTAIFFGETERGPLTPTKITSRSDFDRQYGGYLRVTQQATSAPAGEPKQSVLAYAMDGFFGNGGTAAYVVRTLDMVSGTATAFRSIGAGTSVSPTIKINASSPGIWANVVGTGANWYGGVVVMHVPSSSQPVGALPSLLTEWRILVMVRSLVSGQWSIAEDWDHLSANPSSENYVVDTLLRSLYIRWDPQTPAAAPAASVLDSQQVPLVAAGANLSSLLPGVPTTGITASTTGLSGGLGGADAPSSAYPTTFFPMADEITDAAILVTPRLAADGGPSDTIATNFFSNGVGYAEIRPQRDLFFIGSLPRNNDDTFASTAVTNLVNVNFPGLPKSTLAAAYWPWLKVDDPVGVGKNPTTWVSPDSYVAGLFARTDSQRGVWKAPAGINATLLGVRALEHKIKDVDQDALNTVGINALRLQPAGGLVSWGARTLMPSSEWRYVPVRRTAMMLRKSISDGIQFAVFEPNDEPLWAALRLTIGSFMDRMFKQGAFAGSSAKDAYFVKCDSSTTSAADQAAGVVNILVGFSPLRPAEFVIVKLSQIVAQAA